MKIAINGACGRMGRAIARLAAEDKEMEIVAGIETDESPFVGKGLAEVYGIPGAKGKIFKYSELDKALAGADVLIDFSSPKITEALAEKANKAKVKLVIGTTGIEKETLERVKKKIMDAGNAAVISPNMSIGVNIYFKLCGEMAGLLKGYDAEIIELHHNKKKDAPSGTALKAAEIVSEKMGLKKIYGRQGLVGERPKNEIAIHSVRGGDIVGEHTLMFAGNNERLELTHRAQSRDAFASGALFAAKWVAKQKKGAYDMQDALGLK